MSETVTIILRLPNPMLSPNMPVFSVRGRMARAAMSKKYRREACESTLACNVQTGPWPKAELQATFYHKQNRRRDGVNYNQMLKAAQDGVVDAGLVIDDDAEHLSTLPPKFEIDKKFPRVEITVTRKEGDAR